MAPPTFDDDDIALRPRRFAELLKGVLLPFPLFVAWGALTWLVVYQGDRMGMSSDFPLELVAALGLVVIAGVALLTVKQWKQSRWRAYGVLASFFVFAAVVAALFVLLLIAIGSAIKG
jgi:cytochrome bd-type quinol oxidase subunit 2